MGVDRLAGRRQDSLTDQLRDLAEYARKEGMYDAHDWLLSSVVTLSREAKRAERRTWPTYSEGQADIINKTGA